MVTSARGSGARFYFLVSWVIYLAEEKFQGERVLKLSAAPSKLFYWEGHPRNSEPHVWLPRLMQIVTSGGRELWTERENKLSTGEENYLSACISDKIKSSLSLHWRYIPGNWDMRKKKKSECFILLLGQTFNEIHGMITHRGWSMCMHIYILPILCLYYCARTIYPLLIRCLNSLWYWNAYFMKYMSQMWPLRLC